MNDEVEGNCTERAHACGDFGIVVGLLGNKIGVEVGRSQVEYYRLEWR